MRDPEPRVGSADAVRRTLPAHFRTKSRDADTAGTPWAGRGHAPSPFPGDDGTAPPRLAAALAARERGEDPDLRHLVAALAGTRVLVPIMAVATDPDHGSADAAAPTNPAGEGPAGHPRADNGADMAMVSLRAPDGSASLPVFSSVAALGAWRERARPVPVVAEQAAQAAVQEGCTSLLVDPDGAGGGAVLTRSALWALAQGRVWIPPHEDPAVLAELSTLADRNRAVTSITPGPGGSREVELRVTLVPGLDAPGVRAVVGALSEELSRSELVAERITSLRLSLASS